MAMDPDVTIHLTGPRDSYWYPMSYIWTNEMELKDKVGKPYFTFQPDTSHEYIQFFGEGVEYMDITFNDQLKVYHNVYGTMYYPVKHFLVNNYAYVGTITSPKESTYKCGVEWWWDMAIYAYLAVIAVNIPAAILFQVPMYYSWGLTVSL